MSMTILLAMMADSGKLLQVGQCDCRQLVFIAPIIAKIVKPAALEHLL